VGELVKFYYDWKKSERYDLFPAKAKLENKKLILHAETT